jgi:hypothetical protein
MFLSLVVFAVVFLFAAAVGLAPLLVSAIAAIIALGTTTTRMIVAGVDPVDRMHWAACLQSMVGNDDDAPLISPLSILLVIAVDQGYRRPAMVHR